MASGSSGRTSTDRRGDENIPKPLSDDFIEDIISGLPLIRGLNMETTKSSQESMEVFLRKQLKNVMLTPLGYEEYKREIYRQFQSAVIRPGTMVGANATDAVSAPVMQMTLNTFHHTGAAKNVTAGFTAIREIIKGSSEPKNPSCTIQFKNRHLTYNEMIEDIKPKIVRLSLSRFVADYDIYTYDELLGDGIPYWYQLSEKILGVTVPTKQESHHIARLAIDVDELYRFKVTIGEFVNVLLKEDSSGIKCIHSPIVTDREVRGQALDEDDEVIETTLYPPTIYVDVFPSDEWIMQNGLPGAKSLSNAGRDTVGIVFLELDFLPSLDKIMFRGVPGIDNIYPVESPVWAIVAFEERVKGRQEFVWRLKFDTFKMRMTGVSKINIIYLFETINRFAQDEKKGRVSLDLESNETDYLEIVVPSKESYADFDEVIGKKTPEVIEPHNLVLYWKSKDQKETKERETAAKAERKRLLDSNDPLEKAAGVRYPTQFQITEMFRATNYVYADTDGSNMRELFNRSDVDPYHTYSNNMYEILRTLGIEAARNYMIMALHNIFVSSGQGINTRHVILLVDTMTYGGNVTKATFASVGKQADVWAVASYQQTMKILSNASAFGSTDPMESVASSIFIGKNMDIGPKIEITDQMKETILRMYNTSASGKAVTVDPNSIAEALKYQENPENIYEETTIAYNEGETIVDYLGGTTFDISSLDPNVNIKSLLEEKTDTDGDKVPKTKRSGRPVRKTPTSTPGPESATGSVSLNDVAPMINEAVDQIIKDAPEEPCEMPMKEVVLTKKYPRRFRDENP